jgi:ActD protein
MTSTAAPPKLYGLLAEFRTPDDVVHAAEQTRAAGYARIDAYSPFPVEGLAEALGFHRSRMPMIVFLGAVFGALAGYGLQYFAGAIDYPLIVAGRPPHTWVSFMPVTFECTILFAGLSAVIGMLALNRLPAPHHPLFNVQRFELASRNRFFLCIEATDPRFDLAATRKHLEALGPAHIHEVES